MLGTFKYGLLRLHRTTAYYGKCDQAFKRTNLWRTVRPCHIGILLSVNTSLTNLGTYSQKHTHRKRKHIDFTTKTMHYILYI